MKLIISCFALFLAMNAGPVWQLNAEQAKAEAKADHKLILLNFSGSDWCGQCIKLKKDVFESAEFLAYADKNVVLLRADFPRAAKNQLSKTQTAHNEALAERYNPDGAFPLTVLLDADGRLLHRWPGYPTSMTVQTLTQEINVQRTATH